MRLELVQTASELLIDSLKLLDLAVAFINGVEQLGVGGFSLQEALNEGVYVGDTSSRLDLLEGFIDSLRTAHFLLHLLAHESVPQLMDHELVAPLKLLRVLVLARCCLGNLLVPTLTLNTAVD